MTDDELAAIRTRAEAAIGLGAKDYFEISCWGIEPNLSFGLESNVIATEKEIEADKTFIDNARRDVLTLLAEVERLKELADRWYTHAQQTLTALQFSREQSATLSNEVFQAQDKCRAKENENQELRAEIDRLLRVK